MERKDPLTGMTPGQLAHQTAADAHAVVAAVTSIGRAMCSLDASEELNPTVEALLEAEWKSQDAAMRASRLATWLAPDHASRWFAWGSEEQPSGSQDALDASTQAQAAHQAMANGHPLRIDPADLAYMLTTHRWSAGCQ